MSLLPTLTNKWFLRIVSIIVFGLLWELAYFLNIVNVLFFPALDSIAEGFYVLIASGELPQALAVSLYELGAGYGLCIAIGLPLAILMGWSDKVESFMGPYINILYTVPRVIFISMFIYLLGISNETKIAYVTFGSIPPLVTNVLAGMKDVNPLYVDVARVFNTSKRQLFAKVMLPGSIPHIISGLRIALGAAFIELVVAEILLGFSGIGAIIHSAGHAYEWSIVWSGIFIIAVLSLIISQITRPIEKKYFVWD